MILQLINYKLLDISTCSIKPTCKYASSVLVQFDWNNNLKLRVKEKAEGWYSSNTGQRISDLCFSALGNNVSSLRKFRDWRREPRVVQTFQKLFNRTYESNYSRGIKLLTPAWSTCPEFSKLDTPAFANNPVWLVLFKHRQVINNQGPNYFNLYLLRCSIVKLLVTFCSTSAHWMRQIICITLHYNYRYQINILLIHAEETFVEED